MRSNLSAAYQAEAVKGAVHIVEFAEFVFPGGTIRINTGDRDYVWGGFTWLAQPLLRDYGTISESSELKAKRGSLRLSGVDSALLTRIFTDKYQFSRVQVYLGLCDESWALLADPYAFGPELVMSNNVLRIDVGTKEVEMSAETWDIFDDRDSAVLATPEAQQLRYAGDTGQDRVARIMTQEIEWGGGTSHPGHIPTPRFDYPGDSYDGPPKYNRD